MLRFLSVAVVHTNFKHQMRIHHRTRRDNSNVEGGKNTQEVDYLYVELGENKRRQSPADSEKGNKSSPRRMDKLRRSFRDSFRRRKDTTLSEASKPHLWQNDEMDVRSGTCSFHVKYLGQAEVFESRGMQVCEEALKVLKNSRRRPIKAILQISGDGLRVVEADTKYIVCPEKAQPKRGESNNANIGKMHLTFQVPTTCAKHRPSKRFHFAPPIETTIEDFPTYAETERPEDGCAMDF
ncbi:hypothetical protein U1Q18_048999 [Sarracenia purpurea var. burkii]